MRARFALSAIATAGLGWALLVGGCAARESHRLEVGRLPQTTLGRQMEFAVLRAPELPGVDPAALPVFVLLHGMGGNHLALDEHGLSERLYAAMEDGRIPPAHFVLPDGERGFFVNWYDGTHPYEDYILDEVIPAAEALLGVTPTRERRHLIGVSMGGQGALRIGLAHADRFASAASLSSLVLTREQAADLLDNRLLRWGTDLEHAFGDGTDREFSDALNAYLLVERRPPDLPQKIFLAAGDREWKKFRESTGAFADHLAALGVEHRYVVYDGGHGWDDWLPVIEQAMVYATR